MKTSCYASALASKWIPLPAVSGVEELVVVGTSLPGRQPSWYGCLVYQM